MSTDFEKFDEAKEMCPHKEPVWIIDPFDRPAGYCNDCGHVFPLPERKSMKQIIGEQE